MSNQDINSNIYQKCPLPALDLTPTFNGICA